MNCRHSASTDVYLVGEKPAAEPNQSAIDPEQNATPSIQSNSSGIWRRDTTDLLNEKASLLEKLLQRPEGEEPGVRAIENAFATVVEATEKKHQSRYKETNVRGRQNNFWTLSSGRLA